MELEAELDRLYRASPTAFVALRNQLARALKQAGRREEADRVAKLARPTPVAWLINQLHFDEREALDVLVRTGIELKRAQEALDSPATFAETAS